MSRLSLSQNGSGSQYIYIYIYIYVRWAYLSICDSTNVLSIYGP